MPIFTNKVSKQKFVAKIWDSYWLFVWGEWDNGLNNSESLKKGRRFEGHRTKPIIPEPLKSHQT